MQALFERIRDGNGVDARHPWITSGRRLKAWTDVAPEARPAFFLVSDDSESHVSQSQTLRKRIMRALAWVYTNPKADLEAPADKLLNDALDAIEIALTPTGADKLIGKLTMGGLVDSCYIEGDVQKYPGDTDGDGDGIMVVPLVMLLP